MRGPPGEDVRVEFVHGKSRLSRGNGAVGEGCEAAIRGRRQSAPRLGRTPRLDLPPRRRPPPRPVVRRQVLGHHALLPPRHGFRIERLAPADHAGREQHVRHLQLGAGRRQRLPPPRQGLVQQTAAAVVQQVEHHVAQRAPAAAVPRPPPAGRPVPPPPHTPLPPPPPPPPPPP